MIWIILSIISVLLLIFYYNSRNSVWGGLTIGIVLGLIISFFQVGGFSWIFVGKFIIVCILLGFGAELLGKLGDLLKKK